MLTPAPQAEIFVLRRLKFSCFAGSKQTFRESHMNPALSLRLCAFARALFFLFTFASLCLSQQSSRVVVELRSSLPLKGAAGVAFAPVTKLLAVRQKDATIRIIDVTDSRERASLVLTNKAPAIMIWTADGQRLLIASSKAVTIWDARLGKELAAPLAIKPPKDFLSVVEMTWSPTGNAILGFERDDSFKASLLDKEKTTVRVWSVESGQILLRTNLTGLYGRAQFSPNGKQLLTTSDLEGARLWDVQTGRLIASLKSGRSWFRQGSWGAFSPDGKTVAVQSYAGGIHLWDCATGALNASLALEENNDYVLREFSPDGKMLAIYTERFKGWDIVTSIELRDSVTGELKSTLTGKNMRDSDSQRVWSADSQTYVTGGGSNSKKFEAKIWDVKTGQLKATFPMLLTYSRIPFDFGFKDRDSLSVHPMLPVISASNNKFVRFWSSETGELMQTIEDTGPATWSADGTLLLTYAKDLQVAHVWRVVLQDS
jgi:WD40 repeat protein